MQLFQSEVSDQLKVIVIFIYVALKCSEFLLGNIGVIRNNRGQRFIQSALLYVFIVKVFRVHFLTF